MNSSRTIEQLEATPWPDPSCDAPPYIHRCHALRRVPIEQLTAGDLRALITQDVGLKYLMPIAVRLLTSNPLLESEYYPGDLLCATMGVGADFWLKATSELAALRQLAQQAQELITSHSDPALFRQVAKDVARFLGQSA